MSPTQRMQALLRDVETLAERAREHERVMAAGVRAATAWDPDERDWVVRAAVDARIAREDAHARVVEGRALLARAHRAACSTPGLAVMEDDTVLCGECAHELVDEGAPAAAATTTHAWLENVRNSSRTGATRQMEPVSKRASMVQRAGGREG